MVEYKNRNKKKLDPPNLASSHHLALWQEISRFQKQFCLQVFWSSLLPGWAILISLHLFLQYLSLISFFFWPFFALYGGWLLYSFWISRVSYSKTASLLDGYYQGKDLFQSFVYFFRYEPGLPQLQVLAKQGLILISKNQDKRITLFSLPFWIPLILITSLTLAITQPVPFQKPIPSSPIIILPIGSSGESGKKTGKSLKDFPSNPLSLPKSQPIKKKSSFSLPPAVVAKILRMPSLQKWLKKLPSLSSKTWKEKERQEVLQKLRDFLKQSKIFQDLKKGLPSNSIAQKWSLETWRQNISHPQNLSLLEKTFQKTLFRGKAWEKYFTQNFHPGGRGSQEKKGRRNMILSPQQKNLQEILPFLFWEMERVGIPEVQRKKIQKYYQMLDFRW